MEDINDVLYLLIDLDHKEDVGEQIISNFHNVRNILVENFFHIEVNEVIEMINILEDIHVIYLNKNFKGGCGEVNILREKIFTLMKKRYYNNDNILDGKHTL